MPVIKHRLMPTQSGAVQMVSAQLQPGAMPQPLSDQEFLYFSRQLLLPDWSEARQLQLKHSRVLLVGIGGLGCPTASYLAACGVGELWLADGDQVELSNLPRQILFQHSDLGQNKAQAAARRLQQQHPFLRCKALSQQLAEKELTVLLTKVDLVIDCTDNQDSKLLLNKLCQQLQKCWLGATATAYQGYSWLLHPGRGCLHCLGQDVPLATGGCLAQGAYAPLLAQLACQLVSSAIDVLLQQAPAQNQLQLYQHPQRQFIRCNFTPDPACPICGEGSQGANHAC